MNRIVKNDKVKVISGRYKGSVGLVLRVFPKDNRVLIEGVNKIKKSVKKEGQNYVEKEAPIHLSNVALLDAKTDAIIRVGYRREEDKKMRINRKTKVAILKK